MILTKYRMLFDNGYIETLSLEEAEAHGNFVVVEEDVQEDDILENSSDNQADY